MKILSVVGARPNFIKVAPLHRAFQQEPAIESLIVHTGQHYDARMSDIFFDQLAMPAPTYFLGVGGGSHTQQTAKTMLAFEEVIEKEKPDLLLVVGDVNSTIACTLVAKKANIPVAHVEAGLRSGDRTMPEEINRILTDSVSDYLFVTEQSGMVNLAKEGTPDEKVFFVGNVMIDSLVYAYEQAQKSTVLSEMDVRSKQYCLLTMHRPANVDNPAGLRQIVEIITGLAERQQVVFPIHPRTRQNLAKEGLLADLEQLPGVRLAEPQGYLSFLKLMNEAAVVVTDSGGIQEETTYLGVPCLTLRDTTERPVTVDLGTNRLLADWAPASVVDEVSAVLEGRRKKGSIPPLWDGQTATRIAKILVSLFEPAALSA